jgi:very-short-patch-repair endonuclease
MLIDVTVPEGRRAISGRGVRGHAARVGTNDVVDLRGLRVSSVTRTWCELGAALSVADLVAAGDFFVHRELPYTSIAALHAALLAFAGRRGARRLGAAITMLDDNTASRRESLLRVLAIGQGFTGFVMNMKILTSGGYNYYGDLTFPNERVIVEYQSEYHFDPDQHRKDMTRRSRLEADNWAVMFINADDLANPRELAARIRAVMANHSRRLVGAQTR